MMKLVGFDMARAAADQVYTAAGIGPEDLDVVELHDCFAQNEVLSYEALRLCADGGAEKFVAEETTPTAGATSPIPPEACCRRGIPWAPQASRNVPSW